MSEVLVSVIIPTYNRPRYLERALESVLSQTHAALEVIVVDDNPPESVARLETARLMQLYLGQPRVHYLTHEQNRGGSAARNTGIRAATGEYVAFLDDDDEWLPDKLERQLAVFAQAGPDLALVYTGFAEVNAERGTVRERMPEHRGRIVAPLLKKNYIGTTSTVLCRRSALLAVGLFDEQLPAKQDIDLYLRLAQRYDIDFVGAVLVRFHRHDHPSIGKNLQGALRAHRHFYEKHAALLATDREAHHYRLTADGELALRAGDFPGARRAFAKALSLYPADLRARALFGLAALGPSAYQALRRARVLGRWQKRS